MPGSGIEKGRNGQGGAWCIVTPLSLLRIRVFCNRGRGFLGGGGGGGYGDTRVIIYLVGRLLDI